MLTPPLAVKNLWQLRRTFKQPDATLAEEELPPPSALSPRHSRESRQVLHYNFADNLALREAVSGAR